MALPFYNWSRTAATNASADATVNWAEGQAPSSVNDSGRAMMASSAAFRDDIAGAIVTGGTLTAYTVASYEVFDTLAHMSGQVIAFTPHTVNGATVTLNVDGLGAKPLRSSTGVELLAGTLIAGTPYAATYNNSDAVWYLHGFYGNPYNVPLGAGMDFWLTTAPNSSFVFPTGQAISRTTYSALFALMSTAFGSGDGSTTFNLPDKRGRASFCVDNMGGVTANRLAAGSLAANRHTVGTAGAGGTDTVTLITANLPAYTPTGTVAGTVPVGTDLMNIAGGAAPMTRPSGPATAIAATFTGTAQGGTSAAVDNMPPTILCNYIMRII